jgi:hypothetical protein
MWVALNNAPGKMWYAASSLPTNYSSFPSYALKKPNTIDRAKRIPNLYQFRQDSPSKDVEAMRPREGQ